MKSRRRIQNVTRIFTSSSILKLNRIINRCIDWNKIVGRDIKNKHENKSLITCGINRINIIEPLYSIKKGNKQNNKNYILSYYLCLSEALYHIKGRIKLNEDLIKSKNFYTLSQTSSILLSTLANETLQKIVYKNGLDVIFNFNKYFGIELRNIYDLRHLISIYSVVDKQQSPIEYGEYIRNQSESTDTQLFVNENTIENILPFKHIDRLRLYLYTKYNINNETYNLKMETLYKDIIMSPRIYKIVHKNELDYGTLKVKVFEDKFFSSLFDKDKVVKLTSDAGPFYGIVTEIVESEQKIILNINSFVVDEIKKEVYPLYGIVNQDSFKYFKDKKIGDIVECTERDSEEIKIQFKDGKPFVNIKRLHQESLIYSLRNKRYVPLNEITFNK